MKAAVIGAGAWGTTLAKILAENHHDVTIWSHDQKIADEINGGHENVTLFAGVRLPPTVRATTVLPDACADTAFIVLVTASRFYAETVRKLAPLLDPQTILVSATKGLDPATNKRTSQLMEENLPPELHSRLAVLSGPNIAREIAAHKPATTVIAARDPAVAHAAQKYLSTNYFRVYTNQDVIGTELGGTLKNIIAIAAGIVDGLKLGDNARASLMVRGMAEIIRFGAHYGARPETFFGLAGMGDLITTCSSVLSRNHFVGESLAQGKKMPEILSGMTAVAEGVETARLIHEIAVREGISMPVTEQVFRILFEDKPVAQAISDLMTRDLKAEAM